jgi:hypothetical protein
VVESSESAVTAVLVFKSEEAVGLRDFIDQYQYFMSQTPEETDGAKVFSEADSPRLGVPVVVKGYESITEKLTIHTDKADIPHTRTYLRKKTDVATCFIIQQGPDKDLPAIKDGFQFILDNLAVGEGR